MKSDYVHPIDRHFARNTASISGVEFFWGLAIPVLFESTFLQVFLKEIGASNITVGLIPAILSVGMMLFSLMSAYLTSHLERKKMWVVLTHVAASIPLILFGAFLIFTPADYRVGLFLLCYSVFALLLGLTIPLWQNFTVKIFSPEKAFKGLSIMITVQIATRLAGGLIIFKSVERYSFSVQSASAIFIAAGLLCFAGSFFFLSVKEGGDTGSTVRKEKHSFSTMIDSGREILKNRRYILYLLGSIEIYATTTVIAFYANYAVEWHGIDKGAAAGLFVSFIYLAGIFINILVGWLGLFSLRTKFIIARTSALCGTAAVIFSSTLGHFLAASFLIGLSRGVNQSAHAHAVKQLSGQHDATDYFAISQLLVFPFSAGLPLVSGLLLDISHEYGMLSYMVLFSVMGLIQGVTLFVTVKAGLPGE